MADRYTLADLERARVSMVEIKCRTCPRAGRYRVRTLIERYGRGCEDWIDQLSADCPKRAVTRDYYNRCQAHCPTLVDVFSPPERSYRHDRSA